MNAWYVSAAIQTTIAATSRGDGAALDDLLLGYIICGVSIENRIRYRNIAIFSDMRIQHQL